MLTNDDQTFVAVRLYVALYCATTALLRQGCNHRDAFRRVLAQYPDDRSTRAYLATSLFEQGERDAAEAALRSVIRGQPQLLGRAAFVMAAGSRGRFFFSQRDAAKFLGGEAG